MKTRGTDIRQPRQEVRTYCRSIAPAVGLSLAATAALALPEYGNVWRPPSGCNKYYSSGNGHHFCVVHDMEGYYYTGVSYLNRCDISASIYYAVNGLTDSSDQGAAPGEITQCVLEANYAWHATCWNTWMFGTEHEGFASNPAWFTEAMYQASAGLHRHLCNTYGITKDRNHIIAHGQKLVSGWCTWLAANYPSINCTCNTHTDPGPYWDWTHFMNLIIGEYNGAAVAGSSVPTSVLTGQSFAVTVTMNNNGTTTWTTGGGYKLGSQSAQDNTTWGFSRVALPSSTSPGNNATFTFTATAPTTGGTYTFAWRMVQEGVQWFGDTFSTTITVVAPGTSLSGGTWWGNAYVAGGGNFPVSYTDCGTYWYCWSHFSSCAARGYNATLNPGFQWNGRGFIHMDYVNCGKWGLTGDRIRYRNQDGGLPGTYTDWDSCAHTCSWQQFVDGETQDLYNWNGCYINADESWTTGCGSVCGTATTAVREMHMYGDKWVYLNDWIVFGGYSSSSVSDTANRSLPFAESGVYVYGAVDTTHGNYFVNNVYSGKTPYRVTTGDCGAASGANYLNFKGNAGANGNNNCDNCDAYAFAWVQTPAGAGPQWGVGSDDGVRIWQNGTLIHDNNAARGVTWDQDRILPTGMAAGWNRLLLKVHNGGGGFGGVISLHNGSDFRQVEPSVYMQPNRYTGFSVGSEQDSWYPTITVGTFSYAASPANAASYYTNSTTVSASGTSAGQGPVPYWRTMQYQWGYGMAGDSNYADVSGNPTSANWSHTQTGVTGHRRFHWFAVSQSGRTSFQNSGSSGGWTWQDSGNYARYYDVYVDNVAPLSPSLSSATAASTNQINLAWAIPLDGGINIANSATEANSGITSGGANGYVRGDVGVRVYRNGAAVYQWGAATEFNDTGLTPNTAYTYSIEARDNTSGTRGNWNNTTGPQGSTVAWTLSVAPGTGSVTPDNAILCPGNTVTWTAEGGFGLGTVAKYKYAWDQNASHTWTGAETDWSSGAIQTSPGAAGTWYLHVKGYNGANVENGTYAYSVTAHTLPAAPDAGYTRSQGASLKIKIADLTTNTIQSLGNAVHGTVSKNDTYIFYLPYANDNNNDSFTYTAANTYACTKQATINVTVVLPAGQVQQVTATNNTVTLDFAGIPNYAYAVRRSTNLADWVTLVTTNAPPAGLFRWVDDFSDLGAPPSSAYYRLQRP
jgi:hypothetical protein